LQRCGDLLLLRVELIDTMDGARICAAHARRRALPGVRCETELSRSILRQIKPTLEPAISRMTSRSTAVPERRAGVLLERSTPIRGER
jgi:hypothetical protein